MNVLLSHEIFFLVKILEKIDLFETVHVFNREYKTSPAASS